MRERAERALDVPLLSFLGTSLLDPNEPTAGLRFELGPNVLNAVDILHGGVISTVLDLAAYLAVLSELDEDEEATTHGLAVQFVARAKLPPLRATGRVVRRTRQLAFVSAELRDPERLVAAAQVTKSVYSRWLLSGRISLGRQRPPCPSSVPRTDA
jgi:uncharacterized protein (TIGR00369 family)